MNWLTVALLIFSVLAPTGMAVAQTKFVDNSPAGSPLSLAAIKDATTGDCIVKLHDNDSRPVVAVTVAFDGDHNSYQIKKHDHFLKSDDQVEMHGKDFDMSFECDLPTATITVKLIQFNDGEVWPGSDPKAIADLADERTEEINYLNNAVTAVDIEAEIAKPLKPGKALLADAMMRGALQSNPNPLEAARNALGVAQEHASWLLNLK